MKGYVFAIATVLVLGGCSSPPKVATPSGKHRVPINSDSTIAAHQAQQTKDDAELKRRSDLEASVAALRKQVTDLQTYIILKAAEAEVNTPKGLPVSQGKEPAQKNTAPVASNSALKKELIAARDGSTVFTVTHDFGKTDFNLPDDMKQPLLDAAKSSHRIEIRGRTDASSFNLVDRDIALNRAVRAYGFMVRHGVPAERIRVTYQTAGGFAVDNTTAEGKARNRRVELETFGVASLTAKKAM